MALQIRPDMEAFGRSTLLPLLVFLILLLSPPLLALSDVQAASIARRRQLLTFKRNFFDFPDVLEFAISIDVDFRNSRLKQAHKALRAWKKAIFSDPTNFTGNWVGHDVCSYNGIVCAWKKAIFFMIFAGLKKLESLNIAHNMLSGIVPGSVCGIKSLGNFRLSDNYFKLRGSLGVHIKIRLGIRWQGELFFWRGGNRNQERLVLRCWTNQNQSDVIMQMGPSVMWT